MWLVFLLILLSIPFIYLSRFYQNYQTNQIEGEAYNSFTGKWERTSTASQLPNPSQITKADNVDGLHNYAVIKGYFDQYDEFSQILHIRAAINLTQNNLFEPAKLKLAPTQTIYCVPEIYTDPNTGKSYSLRNLKIPVRDGETLFVPGEKIISFNDFVEQSGQLTLLLIQLTTDFDASQTNYVKKVIVTGLCD